MARRWVDLPLRVKGLAVISIPLAPLLVSAALLAANADSARDAGRSVVHTLDVKSQIRAVVARLVDADTGVRGFLVMPTDAARRVVHQAITDYEATLERLAALVADNPVQVEHLSAVSAFAAPRRLAALIDHTPADASGTAIAPGPSADHVRAMEALREELEAMQKVEDQLLAERSAAAASAQRRLMKMIALGATLGLLGGLIAAVALASSLVSRIDCLRTNAARLSTGEPLLAMPSADDEVGQLSRSLEDAGGLFSRRMAEIEEARAELDQFFSLSLDMLCIAGADGRFSRVNPAWHDVLGWTEAELTSVPYLDFAHPDDVAPTIAAASRLSQGAAVVDFENRYRCKDGTYRWLNWRATPLPQQGLVYATARDVTEQKRTAHALETHAAALGAANDELEGFSYSVSHDLRAPLRHITGFATLLARHAESHLDDQSRRYLSTIEEAAKSMGRLIDDLLTFSRMGRTSLTKRRVRLDEIVREAQREVAAAQKGRAIAWALQPLPEVDGDPALLRLAFVNLLSNAVKYTSTRPQAAIEVGAHGPCNGETVIFVRDNGVGFDMKYAHKLFGVFQRLHSSSEFEGTGIGLANVRRIISRHGGRTWAEGLVDRGATFYVALPNEGGIHDDGDSANSAG